MLISLAVDFRTADLRTREALFLSDEQVGALYGEPRDGCVREIALVSTCNRIELYAWSAAAGADELLAAVDDLARRWVGASGSRGALVAAAKRRSGAAAARHLLRVSAGLESQILGDTQVLGQIRGAYRVATDAGSLGPGLHRLFSTALRTGKRVQTQTALSGPGASVGAQAAALVAARLGGLAGRRCVVIGCGKTGSHAARQLAKSGIGELVLINRTAAAAERLAAELGARVAPWESLHQQLACADAALVVTGAERPPVRAASLAWCRSQADAGDHPLLLVDLSVPRNVEPEAAGIEGVTLVNLDHVAAQQRLAEQARRAAVPAAEQIVEEELSAFVGWVEEGSSRDALRPLREMLAEICRREIGFAAGPDAAERATERIVAKVVGRAMPALRAAADRGCSVDEVAATVHLLFADTGGRSAEPAPLEVRLAVAS
jgi:glutamyl-tRNA reductase